VLSNLATLEFVGAADSKLIPYRRESIPHDQPIAPYTLTGVKRTVFLGLYSLLLLSSISGLIYSLYASPLFVLMMLPVGFVFSNLNFVIGHGRFHASFIEVPEARMNVVCHHAFIHHYRNIGVFHETWLETRVSYFIDARAGVGRTALGFLVLLPVIAVILYQINPVLGIAYLSTQYLVELLQSTIHEWYHNPVRNRKAFYSFPVYWALTFLEKVGIASTKQHTIHHRNQLSNLDDVDLWQDLYMPFGEILPSWLWKNALARYVPGKTYMSDYMQRTGALLKVILILLVNPAIYAGVFLTVSA
jgi:hypothetical protein